MYQLNYANSLLNVSGESYINSYNDFKKIKNFFSKNKNIYLYFTPFYSKQMQISILKELFVFLGGISKLVSKFIIEICLNNRMNYINDIYEKYHDIINKKHNIKNAVIYSATKLSKTEKDYIAKFLENKIQAKTNITNIEDASLLKGFKICVENDLVIDISGKKILDFYINILRGVKNDKFQ